ncbi:MAG: transglycosylase SLT domain-containing protein [Gammaproteobacteria bacterium]|nr:transglycosylase SLT domain-containing protein [Gammaproteobacteria bacterium]
MPRPHVRRGGARKKKSRRRRFRLPKIWPSARFRRRLSRAFRTAPGQVRFIVAAATLLIIWFVANGVYQVFRKPTELYFPVSGALSKTSPETWRNYGSLFRRHSTAVITPDFLAALAQVESTGNPVARTYWRWDMRWDPFKVYRPASSAVGMYQITDGTFAEAKRYCVHHNVVVEDGPWHDWRSCWFNSLYTRVLPTNAVEMASAMLDRRVSNTLARHHIVVATLQQKQDLATVIHLCGAVAGDAFAKRGLRPIDGQRCGDHDVRGYLAKVNAMKRVFLRLQAAE